jgi:hypothetical protein
MRTFRSLVERAHMAEAVTPQALVHELRGGKYLGRQVWFWLRYRLQVSFSISFILNFSFFLVFKF